MYYPPNIPWPAIHEYILEVGKERQPVAFFKKASAGIGRLISFDSVQILFINDVACKLQKIQNTEQDIKNQPAEFYRFSNDNAFQITHQEVLHIPDGYRDTYPYYFKRTDLSVAITPQNPMIMNTNRNVFRKYSFASDWLKPLEMEYSSGMKFINPKANKVILFLLYRSRCQIAFSDLDLAILNILQLHLSNFVINFQNCSDSLPAKDIASKVREFRKLTEKEREIVTLICQGISTSSLCSRLFIAPATVYRHINNIFEKLQVSTRQELMALILQTENIANKDQ